MYFRCVLHLERCIPVYLTLKEANLFKLRSWWALGELNFENKVKILGDKRLVKLYCQEHCVTKEKWIYSTDKERDKREREVF